MKSFFSFLLEVVEREKSIVPYEPPVMTTTSPSDRPLHDHSHPAREVLYGIYERLGDEKEEEESVSDLLGRHEDPHGLVSGIMQGMGRWDKDLIHRYGLHEKVPEVIKIISHPRFV